MRGGVACRRVREGVQRRRVHRVPRAACGVRVRVRLMAARLELLGEVWFTQVFVTIFIGPNQMGLPSVIFFCCF